MTCHDGRLPQGVKTLLSHENANVTTIKLEPLTEAAVVAYVCETLSRSPEYVLPLAIVCLEKTNGNPFYLRQMLELCHRRGAIWYSWKDSSWVYDLDRVFAEFTSAEYGQQLNTNFITQKLQDLPYAARAILAWASLLGTSFSFRLVQHLLSGEFSYADENSQSGCPRKLELSIPQPVSNIVEGLQAALQSYILMPGSNEDEYR